MDDYYFIVSCVLFTILGLCVGSFLNVVIYRLPRGMNLAKPSSHCPKCGNAIKWYDNIPLLSYIILGGKCRFCKEKISVRYFLVELSNGILWFLSAFCFYKVNVWYAATVALFLSVLLCVAFCDFDNMFIPDTFQIALLILGVVGIFADSTAPYYEKLFGLLLGGGFFLLFFVIYEFGLKKEGLGFGDVKLMAGIGLFLGWKQTIVSIIISVFSALIFIIIAKIAKIKSFHKDPYKSEKPSKIQSEDEISSVQPENNNEIINDETCKNAENQFAPQQSDDENSDGIGQFPFAPFLTFGALISLFLGKYIINWYLSLFL